MDPHILFLRHLPAVLLVGCVPAWGLVLGHGLLRIATKRNSSLSYSLALGLGVLALLPFFLLPITLAVNVTPLRPASAWALFILTLLLCHKSLPLLFRGIQDHAVAIVQSWKDAPLTQTLFCLAGAFIILRYLLLAMSPSVFYDVLEYHLHDVRILLDTGFFFPDVGSNSYTYMPQGAESLYALAALFAGGFAPFAPKVMHLYMALGTAVMLNALCRELRIVPALRLWAILLFFLHPIAEKLLFDAFVGMAAAFYAAATLLAWLRALRTQKPLDVFFCALFLGFAFSVKYPVAGLLVLPFLLILAPLLPQQVFPSCIRNTRAIFAIPAKSFLVALIAGIAYFPWLLRALITLRTPFPPLTILRRGITDASPLFNEQLRDIAQFMKESHPVASPFSVRFIESFVDRAPELGLLLLASALVYLLLPRADRKRRGLAAVAVFGYVVWNIAPHSPDRFLAPLLPVFCLLATLLLSDIKRWKPNIGHLATLPLIAWTALLFYNQARTLPARSIRASIQYAIGAIEREECLVESLGNITGTFFNAVNMLAFEHKNPRVLMLYEARMAAFDPAIEIVANTVFDPSLLWEYLKENTSSDAVLNALRKNGVTHLAINEIELSRLLATYPALAAKQDPEYQKAMDAKPADKLVDARLLAFRRYYPPFYYFSPDGNTTGTETRLDQFVAAAIEKSRLVWGTNYEGARIILLELPEEAVSTQKDTSFK